MPFLLVSICDSSSHVTISHFRQSITIPDHVLLLYTSSKHINAICPRIKVLCRIFPQISSAYSHVPILLMSHSSKTIGKSSQWCGTKMALPCTFPVGSNQRSVPSSLFKPCCNLSNTAMSTPSLLKSPGFPSGKMSQDVDFTPT